MSACRVGSEMGRRDRGWSVILEVRVMMTATKTVVTMKRIQNQQFNSNWHWATWTRILPLNG